MVNNAEQLFKTQDFLKADLAKGFCSYLFSAEQSPSTEATAWALIALASSGVSSIEAVIDYLLKNQNIDGGWSTGPGLGTSDWTSGPAVLALRIVDYYQPQSGKRAQDIERGLTNAIHYLLSMRVDFLSPVARLLLLLSKGATGLHYARGWPWDPDCYNWIEPTSYCLMALKIPIVINDEISSSAVFHANKFLLDHACRGGGWNHGSFYSLGTFYPPYRVTTAEALLALPDKPLDNRVRDALKYLSKIEENNHSSMSLAWTVLALNAHGYDCDLHLKQLLTLQNADGSFGTNYFVTALSLLAMNTVNDVNPLRPIKSNANNKVI